MVYFLIFISFLLNLFANSSVTENDPSSLVNGVSVITGDFYSYNEDYLVEGAEPIPIRRAYLSNGSLIIDRPHLLASFLSTLNALVITEPNGTQLCYHTDSHDGPIPKIGDSFFGKSKKPKALYYRSKTFTETSPGVTNTSTGKISGQTHLQNQFVVFDPREDTKGKSFSLFTADGTKRRYVNLEGQTKVKLPFHREETYLGYDYKLVSETLPNGHVIHYTWDHHNRITQIRSTSKNHQKTFASIDFPPYDPKKPPSEFKLKGSDGRSLRYYKKQGESLLEKISAPDLPYQLFNWETKHHPQLSRYSLPNKRTLEIVYEEKAPHRVKTLSSPVGKDEKPLVTESFVYDFARKQTDVRDAKGFKTSYFWNDQHRLTHIDRFEEDDRFKSSEVFVWDGTLLKSKYLVDQDKKPIFLRQYKYDSKGNASEELFFGNLSGEGPPLTINSNGDPIQNGVEHFSKTATYIDLERNLLQERHEAHGLSTRYRYLDGTNLPLSKEILDHGVVKIRHSYAYDDDLILTRETIDDGQTVQIKVIHPVQEGPYLGLPEIIEQKYLDTTQEMLLQKTVLKYTEGAKIKQKEVYDANDKLQYILYFTYENGQLKTESNELGQVAENRYDEVGNRIYSRDFSGRKETTFGYDYSNRLIHKKEKGFDGISRSYEYEYDTTHNLEMERDFRGNETKHKYNALNQKTLTTLPPVLKDNGEIASPVLKYDYDSAGNEIVRIDAENHTTRTAYNAYGKPISILHPDGSTEKYSYNLDGSLKTHTNGSGVITTYTYDYLGRTTSKKTGDTVVEILEYAGFLLTKKIDAEGNETIYTYDKAGRKSTETLGEETTTYTYDSIGRVRATQKGDLCRVYEYDLLGQITQERAESLSGEVFSKTTYIYDEAGNQKEIIRSVNGSEASEIYIYDSQNRLIRKTNPLGHTETVEYNDAFVNELNQKVLKKTHTDAAGLQTIETYDALGRLSSVEKKKSQTLAYSKKRYDLRGLLVLQIDTVFSPDGNKKDVETRWHYNCRGHLDTLTEARTKITSYTYSPEGLLKTVTKPSGTILWYDYNHLGYLVSLTSSDQTVSHQMTYNRVGALLTTDGIVRTVDPYGRISSETHPSGASISNTYNFAGKRKECRIPLFDCCIEYDYNGAYLQRIARKTLRGNSLYSHTYDEHDLSGNLLSSSLINGQKIHYTVDPLSRYTSIQNPHFTQEILQFDPVGNIRKMRIQEDLLAYTYDDLYQLTSETGLFSHHYACDSLNNRLQKDTETYEINDLNQISSHCNYDLDGNLISDGNASYTYDALGRLIRIEMPKQTQIFSYDSLHRCLNKKIIQDGCESVQNFLYDGQKEIGSYNADLSPLELRILGSTPHAEIGAAIAVELNQIPYTPIHDLQGNLAALIPFSNDHPTHYRYSAFGEERIDGPTVSPWGFSSKRTDRTTQLVNFGRRYYIPQLGRWLTPDPAGFSDGMNLYAYVHNDPLTHFDEYGLWGSGYQGDPNQDPLGIMVNPYESLDKYEDSTFDFRNAKGSRILPSLNPNPKYSNHYYVNGIQNTLEDSRAGARTLLNTYQGKANIIPAYSTTFGRKNDLVSVNKSINEADYSTVFIRQFARELQVSILCMEAMQDPRKIFITCFSRGAADVYHACKDLSSEHKKRLIITACGPIMLLPRSLGFIVKNLVSEGDRYSFLCNPGLKDHPEKFDDYAKVLILPQKDGFRGFNKDHFFASKTYQDGILEHCVSDYRDYGEIK